VPLAQSFVSLSHILRRDARVRKGRRCNVGGVINLPLWRNMEISYRANAVEAVFQGSEGRRLWQEHKYTVHALVKIRVLFRLQQLESQI
jgi:hypothetical protein